MAEDKKGFILYADLINVVSKLPDDVAGKLFKIVLSYVNDLEVQIDNLLIEIAFEPIKQQLKRDLKKYEYKKEQWSEAGKRSAEARKVKKSLTDSTDVKTVATDSTVIVKDTVNVTVNDTVKVIKSIEERKTEFKNSLTPFLIIYSKDLLNSFFSYWTEHGEKDKKMRFEKEKSYNIERRLQTWKSNENKFGSKKEKITGAEAFKNLINGSIIDI